MTTPSRHTEWLSLVEVSGPFLAVPVLEKAFPQGLDVVETPKRQRLRAAYEEWCDAVEDNDPLLSDLHREWIRLVFTEILEYDGSTLTTDAEKAKAYSVASPDRTETFAPDWVVVSPSNGEPRLFVSVQPPGTDFERIRKDDGWPASLLERMVALCRSQAVRLGVITDGERWMLVNAPVGGTSSYVSWYARLWFQEPITLKAFQSLWSVRRCFGPSGETLEALLDRSLEHHEEITDTLGEQVRRAVEVLVQCLDKADADRNRELLRDVSPAELYEAGLTVMMRLVFVLCAEERGLLLSGDPVYDECYAVSTLRGRLAEEADRHGPEVLDRRHDAWARLLAVFRAVHGGIEHESLRMPALGGSLFDPDRFPFLEGRSKGTSWRDSDAAPLPIDNRTVLLLLNSLQSLEQSGGALLLSYRALDVEQIGHVYEGLLEHTVVRVPSVTIGLAGSKKAKNPNLPLSELESARMDGEDSLVALVKETTGRSESAIRNALARPVDENVFGRLLAVCGGDTTLAERIRPFANLLRTDAWGEPIVYREGGFMVTLGADRRETGTHYTPKSLTESIVETTLEPVAYIGPAEGKPREEWKLKTPAELLDLKICDPAMGSGAFLVQACRWLAERLVEAWASEEVAGKFITADGEVFDRAGGSDPMPDDLDERLLAARRLIAERCLYGVDVNPLAVELAKLSIWLVTLAKGRPFGFLDHNLRCGDSLLGIHRLDQLTKVKLNPDDGPYQQLIFGQNVAGAVAEAVEIRKRLRSIPIRDVRDVETMARLDAEARKKLEAVELVADAMIGEVLRANGNARTIESAMNNLAEKADAFLGGDVEAGKEISRIARAALSVDLPPGKPPRKPFHWPLEFPEVLGTGGFDAFVDNPPFGSASGGVVTDDERTRSFWRLISTEIAIGAYDRANVFIQQSINKLRMGGRYGFLMPQSNLSPGGATPLQRFINSNAPPTHFLVMENPKIFGGANVFVCGLIGTKGKQSQLITLSVMDRDSDRFETFSWEPTFVKSNRESWWEWISRCRLGRHKPRSKSNSFSPLLERLSSRFVVFAGCATGAAYELSPLVDDEERGETLRLVTTGAIDRYVCTWGVSKQRFLRREYDFPRWPRLDLAPGSVSGSGLRQLNPKIILGGLTKTLEGYFDSEGLYGGVVSTWIVGMRESATDIKKLLGMLEILLNSYVVSWEYSNSFGAQKSPWGGMTIKKKGLEELLLPSECFIAELGNEKIEPNKWNLENDPWDRDIADATSRRSAIEALSDAVNVIEHFRRCDLHSLYSLDEKLQPTISWIFGKTKEEHSEIKDWFRERARLNRPDSIYSYPHKT
jgi:hypothetical protein